MFKLIKIIFSARSKFKLTWQLLQDNRVPFWQKAIPFLPLIYILSPINLLTFAVPLIGQIDDVGITLLAIQAFETVVDDAIIADYQESDVNKR